MVITKQAGKTWLTVRGPETKAIPAPVPENAEIVGIVFKLGVFMPHLPVTELVDIETVLPDASSQSFWLHGSVWQFPNFENADSFLNKLMCEEMLVREPLVEAVLQGQPQNISI